MNEMVSTENGDIELNLLILKFLRQGTCPNVAQLLEEELNKQGHNLLPTRLDWEGNPRHQTIQELERQYPNVRAEHLATLCSMLRLRPGTSHHSLLSPPFPRRPSPRIWHPPQILSHHQLTGFQHSLSVYTNMYQNFQLLRRNLGHVSSVYCLLFDKTGHFVFTGADDWLIKMWSTQNGRLYFTFRGASSEISDMAVSEDNQMIAAGCMDKIILVWSLLSAAPIAVLNKHAGAITALHFCPSAVPGVPPYLVATSGDGSVTFWKFSDEDKMTNQAMFEPQPIRYNEKMRHGRSKMICADFSRGGQFFATGSEDNYVRVYKMDGKNGPTKILEEKAHTMRVDSIQWANHPQLRFISGSKDGSAILWSYRNRNWSNLELKMIHEEGTIVQKKNEALRVTMVCWNIDDSKIITAVSDFSLCVWDPNTAVMIARLKGHKDEVYVLEPHPSMPEFLMSGGHDGNLIIWDISTNEILFQHQNIDGQGYAGMYDAKWSPDSLYVAASDSNGHVLFFGASSKEPYENCPEKQFFNTDYHPLLRDSNHYVLDEQTQCPPHLLPPPVLVDMEGNAYPDDIQKLVPGREHLPTKETISPELNSTDPNGNGTRFHQPTEQQPLCGIVQFIIDDLIQDLPCFEGSECFHGQEVGDSTNLVIDNRTGPSTNISPGSGTRPQITGSGDFEGSAQRIHFQLPPIVGSIWRQRQLVPISRFKGAKDAYARREELGFEERKLYKAESVKKGLLSDYSDGHNEHDEIVNENDTKPGRKRKARSSTPTSGFPSEKRMRCELQRGNKENEIESEYIDEKFDTSSGDERDSNESKKEKVKLLPYMCPHCHRCYSNQSIVISHMKTCRFKT